MPACIENFYGNNEDCVLFLAHWLQMLLFPARCRITHEPSNMVQCGIKVWGIFYIISPPKVWCFGVKETADDIMSDSADGGGSEQDDFSFLRTVNLFFSSPSVRFHTWFNSNVLASVCDIWRGLALAIAYQDVQQTFCSRVFIQSVCYTAILIGHSTLIPLLSWM